MIKKLVAPFILAGFFLTQGLFAESLSQDNSPKIAVILSTHSHHDMEENIALQYVTGLLNKGVVPQKPVFRLVTAVGDKDLSHQVQSLYQQGVQFFVGPLIIDDIQVIAKALPETNNYVVISTTFSADEMPANNIIRFSVSNTTAAPYRLALYRETFGSLKPIIIYDKSQWAALRDRTYENIALKQIQFSRPEELSAILSRQLPNTTSPIILLSTDVKASLEALPNIANPIVLGTLGPFDDLTLIKNPAVKNLQLYGIAIDVRNMMNFPLSQLIVGRVLPPSITNLVHAMYFATDTLSSGQTTGSLLNRVLNSATGLLDKTGQPTVFACLMVRYNQQTHTWEVLRKIEQYGNGMKFSAVTFR